MRTNSSDPIGQTVEWLDADKASGDVLSGAGGWWELEGYPELTLFSKSLSLPMLKSTAGEYSTAMGDKTHFTAKNQTLNELQHTFIERVDQNVVNALRCIQTGGHNGKLTARYYTGNGEFHESKLWGELKYVHIGIEDNPEIDNESTESPMSISITVKGHFFPAKPIIDQNVRSKAIAVAKNLGANDGLGIKC